MPLNERLRAARVAAGHDNVIAFAVQIGIHPNTVYRIENGKMNPQLATLRKWAEACRVSIGSLLDAENAAR